jgi:acetyl esterase/lipase
MPACVAALSPWTDLAGTGASVEANNGRCDMFRPENIRAFADAYLGTASPDDPRASPLLGVVDGLPPVLLQVGSTELLLDDARRMHERIRSAGGESHLSTYEGVAHAWHLGIPFLPEAVHAVREVASFVERHLTHAGATSLDDPSVRQ